MSSVEAPSQTIAFGTSAYYFASWLPHGDGQTYDFGFISAPQFWKGNPDLDFRHQGTKYVDGAAKRVTSDGRAILTFLDGHCKVMVMSQVKDEMFWRTSTGH